MKYTKLEVCLKPSEVIWISCKLQPVKHRLVPDNSTRVVQKVLSSTSKKKYEATCIILLRKSSSYRKSQEKWSRFIWHLLYHCHLRYLVRNVKSLVKYEIWRTLNEYEQRRKHPNKFRRTRHHRIVFSWSHGHFVGVSTIYLSFIQSYFDLVSLKLDVDSIKRSKDSIKLLFYQ